MSAFDRVMAAAAEQLEQHAAERQAELSLARLREAIAAMDLDDLRRLLERLHRAVRTLEAQGVSS